MRGLRDSRAVRGFTVTEMLVSAFIAALGIFAVVAAILLVLNAHGGVCLFGDASALPRPGIPVVLGGDVDESPEDEEFYESVGSDGEAESRPESARQSPYDYAQQCGRKNCRIASASDVTGFAKPARQA